MHELPGSQRGAGIGGQPTFAIVHTENTGRLDP